MIYKLWNQGLQRSLQHPAFGEWQTTDVEQAQSMLKACHEYLAASGLGSMISEFVVIDETGKTYDANRQ